MTLSVINWSWYKVDARICKDVNFETTDNYVRDFTVILILEKFNEISWKTSFAIQQTILLTFSNFQTALKSRQWPQN